MNFITPMNEDEKFSYEYLVNQGFNNVVFEPDGNIPPDFLVDGSIAVEVRRLNQHIKTNNKSEPLEELQFKIEPKLKEIVKELDIKFPGYSVFISIKYQRPLRVTKKLANKIREGILEHLSLKQSHATFKVNENLEIRLIRLEGSNIQSLAIGSIIDFDAEQITKADRHACHALCKKANPAPRYGGLVPPFY
jgi:hypothetical protein